MRNVRHPRCRQMYLRRSTRLALFTKMNAYNARGVLLLILISFSSTLLKAQLCNQGSVFNATETQSSDYILFNTANESIDSAEVRYVAFDIQRNTQNSFKITGTSGVSYSYRICNGGSTLQFGTANANQTINLNSSIYSSIDCPDNLTLRFMHEEGDGMGNSVPQNTRVTITTYAACPNSGVITFSDPNIDLNDGLCNENENVILDLGNLKDSNGQNFDTECILANGKFYYINDSDPKVEVPLIGGQFILNKSNLNVGYQRIDFEYTCPTTGNEFYLNRFLNVVEAPKAMFSGDINIDCVQPGHFEVLSEFLSDDSSPGEFHITHPNGIDMDTVFTNGGYPFEEEGCYSINFIANDPYGCSPIVVEDNISVNISFENDIYFSLPSVASCQNEPFTISATIPSDLYNLPGTTHTWSITKSENGATPTNIPGIPQGSTLSYTADPPNDFEEIIYEICIEQTSNNPVVCGGLNTNSNCTQSTCRIITVFNDGNNCKCPAPEIDVCSVGDSPSLTIGCTFFEIDFFDVIEAELNRSQSTYFCSDDVVILDSYESNILGFDASPGNTDGDKIEDLPGADFICEFFDFCICVDLGLFDIEIKPLKVLYDELGCGKTISEVVFGILSKALQGDGGGGQLVVDTDGDGAFDYVVEEGGFPLSGSNIDIPNRVNRSGKITARMVTGWPNTPSGVCGDVSVEGTDLFELLPIGAIPVIGVIIEDALESAGCGVDLSWSSANEITYNIVNNSDPEFINCPEMDTLVVSEDYSCTTEANWSIPVAKDGCEGSILSYIGSSDDGITGGTGVMHLSGPLPGTTLEVGTYPIEYRAEACNGETTLCTFFLKIDAGDPVLIVPESITLPMDADDCVATGTGLAPLSGFGCGTTITYTTSDNDFPAGTGDVSGNPFKRGSTTVNYTMTYENASGTELSSTESFIVNVVDQQRPVALCKDIEARLENDGTVEITAAEFDSGSYDNCIQDNLTITIQKPGEVPSSSVVFNCYEEGLNLLTLEVTDISGNSNTCIASVNISDYFTDVELTLDLPEICLEANNPAQFDFTNYLNITNPLDGGNVVQHENVSATFGNDVTGVFAITSFVPSTGTYTNDPNIGTGPNDPGMVGYIDPFTGIYTPGTGTGYVTVTYLLTINEMIDQDDFFIEGCFVMVHETFELRQPLEMGEPECVCGDFTNRYVDLGVVTGGLEPYTIQYSGATLDINEDGLADNSSGTYTFGTSSGHDISDFEEDLGQLNVDYTQPVWSITIVDARGCEIFRSGSCDNDDAAEAPSITCPDDIGVIYTDEYVCTNFEEWLHPDILNGLLYDNCFIRQYNYYIENADGTVEGPFDLGPLVNIEDDGSTNIDPSLFEASHNFQKGLSTVFYYAADAVGNFIDCQFTVTVEDNLPPRFINCPYPPVVENAETDHCDAYVNFALPLAEDNCDVPIVTQIDNTGLTTGDRFPVGTTIMYWEAIDESDNRDTCQVKVIVNDYWNVPEIVCPEDVLQTTDEWRCDAEVYNIAPTISSVCQDNLSVFYEIFSDAALTNRISCGVWDASGEKFDKGDSWVKYTVESQPLLLISEISQSAALDQLEIVNLGPASIDISCLEVVRYAIGGIYSETLPMVSMLPSLEPTILGVGEVMVFDFTEDAPGDIPICYLIQYMGVEIDQVTVNGYTGPVACAAFDGTLNSGDVYRHCEADTDNAADWVAAENCSPLTIGQLNPDLEAMPDNGTQTSLQSEPASSAYCVFQVTIIDDEDPFCGELALTPNNYTGPAINNISETTCNRSEIEILDGCIIGLLDFNLTGNVTPSNATITLISPEGVEVEITTLPASPFDYYTFKSEGIWTLDIKPNAGVTGLEVTAWTLDITCMLPFTMDDVVLPNDPDLCGAQFDWIHPWFVDNCVEGTITVEYLSDDADCVPAGGQLADFGGQDVSEFFCVGTTTVLYTLVDEAGNDHQCSFDVTVEDVQDPVVVCPNDIIIQLDGGECRKLVCFEPVSATDNCEVVDTVYSTEPCTEFEIGITPVTITIFDEAGNSDVCTFDIEIIEYVPDPYIMVCNDLVNVSLGVDCSEELHADMILEGDNYHCYEDYIITISDVNGPISTSPSVTINDVGNTYTVMVYDPDSDNSCWGEITIEDYNIPQLECPADITISCLDSNEASYTGEAILTSCEASTDWIINDTWENFDNCDDVQSEITRIWTVVDESGNANNCIQTIQIERIQLGDIIFPSNYDGIDNPAIDCADAANPSMTSPSATGTPRVGSHNLNVGPNCGLSINVEDQEFTLCAGSYDIIRTWTVYDGCLPAVPGINPIAYSQVIKVVDNSAPVLSCPDDMTISVDADNNCKATFDVPAIGVNDACSSYEVITNTPNGSIFGNGGLITDIPKGTFDIKYQVQDDCNNISACEFKLTIIDGITPSMICLEQTEVTLTSDGTAVATYDSFDNGTYDNCCLDYFEVSRMDDNIFGETVSFDCEDDIVMVQLRAFDCYGNSNVCMVEVTVADKINPMVLCPSNATIDCNIYNTDYAAALESAQIDLSNDPNLSTDDVYGFLNNTFGSITAIDNCALTTSLTVNYEVDQCGEGTISRTWTAEDPSGNIAAPCTQTISVEHQSDWTINFPENWSGELEADCTVPEIGYGEPAVTDDNCEMIAVSYADEIFNVTADACYKIVRTWTAINWCTYDPNISAEDAILVSASDNIYQVTGDSYITYTQTLDVYDTTAPEIETIDDITIGITTDCAVDFILPDPVVLNECSGYTVTANSTDLAAFGNDMQYSNVVSGTYTVSYQIMDDCGNSSFETFELIVRDEKAPTAFCTDELVIDLMPDGNGGGMATINAADFNFGSFDNCTVDQNLSYSFSADQTETTASFDCSDSGEQTLTMYVWDEAGNSDHCVVTLDVQQNNVDCGTGTLTLSGSVHTENDLAVESVIIDLNGGVQSTNTDANGFYSFADLAEGLDYSAVPSLDENPLAGVSTFDIVLLTQHILGIQNLDSPYKLIAADANNSGSISTLDIVDIRKLILGINANFTNNTSFRFVDADYVFENEENPFLEGFPELVNINNLNSNTEANFIAIKVGDLNGSFDPQGFLLNQERDKSKTMRITTKNQQIKAGDLVQITLTSDAVVKGFQFTLDFNPSSLQLVDLQNALLSEKNLGLQNSGEGIITCSWNDSKAIDLNHEDLISFVFHATEDFILSDVMNINSRLTRAEAYTSSDVVIDIAMEFEEMEFNGSTILYQNTPNPFIGKTLIGFTLAKAETINLTIRDINGRIINSISQNCKKGYNSIEVNNIPLGVHYYTLEAGDYSATKKMIYL